jgi:hypothetical protein
VKEREEHRKRFQKADRKALAASTKLYKQKITEEKRVARETAMVVREKEKADKEVALAAQIEAQNTQ